MKYEYVPEWDVAIVWTIDPGVEGYLELGISPKEQDIDLEWDATKDQEVALLPSAGDSPYRRAIGAVVIPLFVTQEEIAILLDKFNEPHDQDFFRFVYGELQRIMAGEDPTAETPLLRRWTQDEWDGLMSRIKPHWATSKTATVNDELLGAENG